MIATLYFLAQTIFMGEFKSLEYQKMNTNSDRVLKEINKDLDQINHMNKDWADWDDTYYFLKSKDIESYNKNLDYTSVANLQLDLFLLTHKDSIIVSKELGEDDFKKTNDSFINEIKTHKELFNIKNESENILSFIEFKGHGVWLVSARGVTLSDRSTPYIGSLIMAKRVNPSYFKKISEKLNLNIKFTEISPFPKNDLIETENLLIKNENLKLSNGKYIIFENIQESKIILSGKKSFYQFIAVASFIYLFILLIIFYILEKKIFSRLINLVHEINKIDVNNATKIEEQFNDNEEINKLIQTINHFIDRIKQDYELLVQKGKFESLGLMAGGIAHEINNPLTVIKINTKKVLSSLEKNMQEIHSIPINKLQKNLATIDRIVEIIQGLKKISRQSPDDELEVVYAEDIIKDIQSIEYGLLQDKDVSIEYIIKDEGLKFLGLEAQISQILINLIVNSQHAIKDLDDKWIVVTLEENGEEVIFSVTDSGPGIPKNIQDKMMDPFFTTKDIGKGTGLGLSVCRKIARFHSGDIEIDTHCKNTKFTLSLPSHKNGAIKTAS